MNIRHLAPVLAAAAIATLSAGAAGQQRYWHDGRQQRLLWIETGVVADFSAPTLDAAAVMKPAALAQGDPAMTSPVFRDGTGENSRRRALPGGVILRFREGLQAGQPQAIASRHGLTLERELGSGGRTWLVKSPAGLASLDLANRLHDSGDFESASPNWWQPRTPK